MATKSKNDPKAMAALAAMTPEQRMDAFYSAKFDPYNRILAEVISAETQQEAAEAFAQCRELLQQLSPEDRKGMTQEIDKIIAEKPVT